MQGNLHLIGLGGAGINITVDIFPKLATLGDQFSKVDLQLLDTTDKTIQAHETYREFFTRISSSRTSMKELDGAGGERDALIANDINIATRKFVDGLKAKGKNDYYVVIASGSGGE